MSLTFKMTGDYAGAMVTVIPIVMLLCAVEAKAVYERWDKRADEVMARVVEAQAGGPDQLLRWFVRNPSHWWPFLMVHMGTAWWWGLGLMHLVSEVGLIFWLATKEQPDAGWLAGLTAVTAVLGMATVTIVGLLAVMVRTTKRHNEAVRKALQAQRSTAADTDPSTSQVSA
ncbi:hypothetical protein ACWFRM_43580 [Streptomyces sp. NPDC055144]